MEEQAVTRTVAAIVRAAGAVGRFDWSLLRSPAQAACKLSELTAEYAAATLAAPEKYAWKRSTSGFPSLPVLPGLRTHWRARRIRPGRSRRRARRPSSACQRSVSVRSVGLRLLRCRAALTPRRTFRFHQARVIW